MKAPVAVALIVVGAFLILGPAIADHLARAQIVEVMNQQKIMSVNLQPPPMSSAYRFGCWFAGGLMIAAATLKSRNHKPQP